ncbi:MAG: LytTR family transcriptional regulator DNA-binding domain-containing protein [Pseudomonadota bacterium]
MNDTPLQSTMRELQRQFSTGRLWITLAAVSLLLGVVGPFGTYVQHGLLERIAYWTAVVVSTYAVGVATVGFVVRRFRLHGRAGPGGYALAGAIAGLPVFAVVYVFNGFVFGFDRPLDAGFVAVSCVLIAAVLSALISLFVPSQATALATQPPPPPASTGAARPPILQRLPPALRGQLAYMSMQDHYVDVRTDKGGTLVLMRFADAIAEAAGVPGLQVHRSHWVAAAAVADTVRREGRLMLRMLDGTELPVSRPYLAAVREAGFPTRPG